MRKSERKIKKYEIILCILVLAAVAAGLLLPKTGELVLLDELCSISVIWIVCIYVVVRVIHNWKTGEKSTKTAGVIIAAVCAAVCLWFTKDLAADLVSGTKTVMLTDIPAFSHITIICWGRILRGKGSVWKYQQMTIRGRDWREIQLRFLCIMSIPDGLCRCAERKW